MSSFAAKPWPYASSCLRAGCRFTINEGPRPPVIGIIAAQLLYKRRLLYSLTCLVAILLQIGLVVLLNGARWLDYIQLVAIPVVNVVFIVNVGGDASASLAERGCRLERILERAWAIILIDAAITLATVVAVSSLVANGAQDIIMGVLVLFMLAMLAYAEPFAALEDETNALTLVPFAILRSMMLAWVNVPRICLIFVLQMLQTAGGYALVYWLQAVRVPGADFWGIAYNTLTTGVLAAIFTVMYLDTLSQERERAS